MLAVTAGFAIDPMCCNQKQTSHCHHRGLKVVRNKIRKKIVRKQRHRRNDHQPRKPQNKNDRAAMMFEAMQERKNPHRNNQNSQNPVKVRMNQVVASQHRNRQKDQWGHQTMNGANKRKKHSKTIPARCSELFKKGSVGSRLLEFHEPPLCSPRPKAVN